MVGTYMPSSIVLYIISFTYVQTLQLSSISCIQLINLILIAISIIKSR